MNRGGELLRKSGKLTCYTYLVYEIAMPTIKVMSWNIQSLGPAKLNRGVWLKNDREKKGKTHKSLK